ncbi:fused MFS/spermidine synthase [Catenovulum sp. 2E275]|uniref:spermidine synthase n=1 Tax=Catenovulum sp. 2E275 TaxID=2980497 RepID=UPI0021D2AB7E|nr:fused MFS/spermidine synthase [Catenovulum sp. 2E275]MCU4676330.1 fused MFS/spermidine synthase [Catenovulum sp. 2E275]
MQKFNTLFKTSGLIFLASLCFNVSAKQIEKARSIYRNVVIVEEDNIRCMQFETRKRNATNQTCINLDDKNSLVFEYAKGTLAGLALNPTPQRVLILGLGGGTLSNVIHQISPQSEIIAVDIDPVVKDMAIKYFDYQENDKVKTEVKDARVYVKRALVNQEKFDWIILDAFNGDYIPEHLMTQEFLKEVKSLLNNNGFITANTFSSSELYHYESATYQSVFGKLLTYKTPAKGNRLIFACNCHNLEFPANINPQLNNQLSQYSVNYNLILQNITDKIDWDQNSEILTDQYSPANLLK